MQLGQQLGVDLRQIARRPLTRGMDGANQGIEGNFSKTGGNDPNKLRELALAQLQISRVTDSAFGQVRPRPPAKHP
jgi:hypothetical protein